MNPGRAGFEGYKPEIAIGAGNPEALKYGELWKHPEYRAVAPGEELAQVFLAQARPKPGADVIDFGCGTGRGALMLVLLGRVRVTMVDFVRNCLDPELQEALTTQADVLRFVKHDLEQPFRIAAEYGFCTDLMEHIPAARVDQTLANILASAQHCFFSIATVEDRCGALIDAPLHLTVRPYHWWLTKLASLGCIVHWSQETAERALFYVTAWTSGEQVAGAGSLNAPIEQVRANVSKNIEQEVRFTDEHGACIHPTVEGEVPR